MSNHQILTDAQLAEIEARANAASAGPWTRWKGHGKVFAGEVIENECGHIKGTVAEICDTDYMDDDFECAISLDPIQNADFIARARTDVPTLIASHRAQGEEIKRLRGALGLYRALRAVDGHGCPSAGVAPRGYDAAKYLEADIAVEEWEARNTAARGEE